MHNPILEHKKLPCGCIMSLAYKIPYFPRAVYKPCNSCILHMCSTKERLKNSENLRKKIVFEPKREIIKLHKDEQIIEEEEFELIKTSVQKIAAEERGPVTAKVENSEGSFTISFDSPTVLEDEITVTTNHHIFK
jgi:hypothetical protein